MGTENNMHHLNGDSPSFLQISLGLLSLWIWAGSPGCFQCSLKAVSSPCTLIIEHCVQEAPVYHEGFPRWFFLPVCSWERGMEKSQALLRAMETLALKR